MEKSEKVLWDKCFESMSEDEYCSTTLGKLNDIFKEYLIDKAAAYDRLIEKLSLWGKHLKSASMTQNSLDFIYCAQQVMDEITLTLPDGWEEA
jgi:hypothetical protein